MDLMTGQFEELVKDIQRSYEEGVTVEEAERLAGKFLHAQISASEEFRKADLDARMRKSGLKAVKAAVYMTNATKTEKKPSDTYLEAIINMDEIVIAEQKALDEAEVLVDQLRTYLSVFKEAHIHFRSIAKGAMNG